MLLRLLLLVIFSHVTVVTSNGGCEEAVEDDKWKELLPFLEDVVSVEDVCVVRTSEGNYTGQVVDTGLRHGWGEMEWENGTIYGSKGQFYYSQGDKYLGEWRQGTQEGIGTLFSRTGVYVGQWRDGLQNGNGTAMYNNGNQYRGMFRDGFKHGQGEFSVANGDIYTGQFRYGQRHGDGIEIFSSGDRYVGQYENDTRHGLGTAYYPSGQLKYVGQWYVGSPHGNGTYVALNGDKYVGSFRQGTIVGPGTIYQVDGNIRFIQDDESIQFRNASNKYWDLLVSIIDVMGLSNFFQKYRSFYNNVLYPMLPG